MPNNQPPSQFSIGMMVRKHGLRGVFQIVDGPNRKGEFQLALGNLTAWVPANELEAAELKTKSRKSEPASPIVFRKKKPASTPASVDLHGMTTRDALARVEELINRAVLDGVEQLQIIHGLGSGAVKNAVHEYLRGLRVVASFRLDQGNPGVTWVYL